MHPRVPGLVHACMTINGDKLPRMILEMVPTYYKAFFKGGALCQELLLETAVLLVMWSWLFKIFILSLKLFEQSGNLWATNSKSAQ
jgi:hypothetical protein